MVMVVFVYVFSILKISLCYHSIFMMLLIVEMMNLGSLVIVSLYFMFLESVVVYILFMLIMVLGASIGLSVMIKNFRFFFNGDGFINFLNLC
uniref:NADH dehydrogenase subunit 4L n=1 Tax=Parasacculina shiinoi TaxID=2836419 RepID=UPI002551FD6D|nr:NADH dehydrogenase subunit 4L [Parasacculina shiinoi]WGU20868.1 NADH dehydrogenase subunit 4L [Parasacculina shiinoi]